MFRLLFNEVPSGLSIMKGNNSNLVPPGLVNFSNWENIPKFAILTGRNGSGKSQLLSYINKIIDFKNRPLRDYPYISQYYNAEQFIFYINKQSKTKITEENSNLLNEEKLKELKKDPKKILDLIKLIIVKKDSLGLDESKEFVTVYNDLLKNLSYDRQK